MIIVNHVSSRPAGLAVLGAGAAVELGVGHGEGGGLGDEHGAGRAGEQQLRGVAALRPVQGPCME